MDIQDLQSALFSKFQANPSSKGFLIMLATATVPSTYLMYSDLISWNLSPASVLLATVSQTEWYLRNDRGLIFVRSSPRWSAQRVDAFAVVVWNGLEWFGSRDWKQHDLTISRTGINWYPCDLRQWHGAFLQLQRPPCRLSCIAAVSWKLWRNGPGLN